MTQGSERGARAAMRDASFTSKPGRASRYHVLVGEADNPLAACNQHPNFGRGQPMDVWNARDAADVPLILRCQRPGCKNRWPSSSGGKA